MWITYLEGIRNDLLDLKAKVVLFLGIPCLSLNGDFKGDLAPVGPLHASLCLLIDQQPISSNTLAVSILIFCFRKS